MVAFRIKVTLDIGTPDHTDTAVFQADWNEHPELGIEEFAAHAASEVITRIGEMTQHTLSADDGPEPLVH